MMTCDDTAETVLQDVCEQACQHPRHAVRALVRGAQAARPTLPPIEVLSAASGWLELLMPCDLEVAAGTADLLSQLQPDLPEDIGVQVGHACRELLMNATEWGGKLDPNQKVRVSYLRGRRMLLYRIADPGTGFCFEGLKHAAVANSPDEVCKHLEERNRRGLRPGGFGILMVKAVADELLYNEAQNEVVFVKYLDQ